MMQTQADAEALCARAGALIDAGRANAARPLVAAARALGGETTHSLMLSARLAAADEDWPEALATLDRAVGQAPQDALLRKYRAETRHRMGAIEGAARDAAEAVLLDPGDARAKALLGAALLDLGNLQDAAACLREAVAAAPREALYHEALAAALERSGDTDGAVAALAGGIGANPQAISIRNAAILLCIRRRDFHGAVRLAEAAQAAGIAVGATYEMKGQALTSLGRHDDARLAFQDALKLDPRNMHVRHLVAASGALPGPRQAPAEFIRASFDQCADRFESELVELGYGIPGAIRAILETHPRIAARQAVGPVLDLGCGTGLVALAVGDLPLGPFTGIDLSPRMLAHARVKRLYDTLLEGEIVAELNRLSEQWPVILAADVACYFGALEDLLTAVHQRLQPGGWFIFSAEMLLPDHDGIVPENGNWALGREGRYAHAPHYVHEAACAAGFRVLRFDRPLIRQERGIGAPGLLLTLERMASF